MILKGDKNDQLSRLSSALDWIESATKFFRGLPSDVLEFSQ